MRILQLLFLLSYIIGKPYTIHIKINAISGENIELAKPKLKARIKNLNRSNTYFFYIDNCENDIRCKCTPQVSLAQIDQEIDKLSAFESYKATYEGSKHVCDRLFDLVARDTENIGIILLGKPDDLHTSGMLERNYGVEIVCPDTNCDSAFEYENKQLGTKTLLDLSEPVIGSIAKCRENTDYPDKTSDETIDYECPPNTQISQPLKCSEHGTWPKFHCQCPRMFLWELGITQKYPCRITDKNEVCETICGKNLHNHAKAILKCHGDTLKWTFEEQSMCVCNPETYDLPAIFITGPEVKSESPNHVDFQKCQATPIGSKCSYTCRNKALENAAVVTCTPLGWNRAPSCEKEMCLSKPRVAEACFDDSCVGMYVNGVCETKCRPGFHLAGENPVCGNDKKWFTDKTVCAKNTLSQFRSKRVDLNQNKMEPKFCVDSCVEIFVKSKSNCENNQIRINKNCVPLKYVRSICKLNCCYVNNK